ncbi:uncharacterized protein FYW61_002553 [Anableps anableps]
MFVLSGRERIVIMSENGLDKEQPMDVDPPEPAEMASPKHQDEVLLTLSLKWLQKPEKLRLFLEKSLQTWFNKSKIKTNCSVEKTLADSVVIKITPPPAVNDLQKLKDETLTQKDGTKTVTILSVSLGSQNMDAQMADDTTANTPPSAASINSKPSVSELPAENAQLEGQKDSIAGNPPHDDKKRPEDCLVPLGLYCYVSQIYKNEIKRIEKETKVTITPNVMVKFEANQEDGKPSEASARFTDLVQKYISDSTSSVIPLKFVDPAQWGDALKVISNNDNKLLVTMLSDEMIVHGPKHCQTSLNSTLNAMQKSSTASEESKQPSWSQNFNGDGCLKITMTMKDDLAHSGLTIDEKQWKILTSSNDNRLAKIKTKFSVDFKESSISEGKVNVKASYKRPGGNPAMESHAVRALLRLYQKMMMSRLPLPPPYGATVGHCGLWGSEEGSSGAGLSNHLTHNREESAAGGATGDSKDDRCPICLSEFTNKKQLKCKHEYCEECLQNAVKQCGPICPICKDVFGEMKGDQPDGTMTWNIISNPLPGFPNCGHICITYHFPNGKQMENHPKPGELYTGTTRIAYLPDNKEGREVLQLLEKAFKQKLIFTVGASRTTGMENVVTWNDIHHKTSMSGGCHGYPDENYLSRVKEELKDKGIK